MTTTDVPSTWSAQPAPEPPVAHKPRSKAVMALFVSAVLALAALALAVQTQHAHAVAARSDAAATHSTLTSTQKALATSKTDLKDAQSTISEDQTTLSACALVVKVSNHQYDTVQDLTKATRATLNSDYFGASDYIGQAMPEIRAVNNILRNGGYSTYQELWGACAPGGLNG